MTIKIAINGSIFDEATASISVLDRGFLYGDSVYEVVRTYHGRPFAFDEHLQRLKRSADLLCISLPLTVEELRQEVISTLAEAANAESYIRIIITRGAGPISLDPHLAVHPCRVIIVAPIHLYPQELYAKGAAIHLVAAGRDVGGAVPMGAKSGNYLVNIMALGTARKHGAHEAVLLDSKGRITEGASSNIFVLFGKKLCTTPLSVGILEGITRHKVIALAQELGLQFVEQDLYPEDLQRADEIFITSTLREILPVTQVDDLQIAGGLVGEITRQLQKQYSKLVESE